ncbi:hypothetical protein [Mammaliicoccus sciuri]|uniref:hypothetical protein n=1 Tax=Mammaliicoccus sciuri TaxID=1296 RepID=UPI002B260985|nr:hypothetical protein [Mammaliicoccus sciuri]WQK75181.1 hypothetical protein P3U33_05485 [Mammaliicoccus sciuri]
MMKTEFNLLKTNAEKNYLYLPFNTNKKLVEILLKHEIKQAHLPLLDIQFTNQLNSTSYIKIYYNDLLIDKIPYQSKRLVNMTHQEFKNQTVHNFNIIVKQLLKGGYLK